MLLYIERETTRPASLFPKAVGNLLSATPLARRIVGSRLTRRGMTLALPYSVQRFSRHVDDELAGRPGRLRADEGAPRCRATERLSDLVFQSLERGTGLNPLAICVRSHDSRQARGQCEFVWRISQC